MAIEFKDGKYVDPQTGRVTLDPTVYKDWQIAEEAEKNLPSVDYFREKTGSRPNISVTHPDLQLQRLPREARPAARRDHSLRQDPEDRLHQGHEASEG